MILHPERFNQARPAGFDGVFEWDFLKGAFGLRIMPMDIDAIVERFGNFLVFETKDIGVPVPVGQKITLDALHKTGLFSIVFVSGKIQAEECEVWAPGKKCKKVSCDNDYIYDLSCRWFQYANRNKK